MSNNPHILDLLKSKVLCDFFTFLFNAFLYFPKDEK